MQLIFEKSAKGRKGWQIPQTDVPQAQELPQNLRRKKEINLPEVSELDVVRHFTQLSHRNFGVDSHFYPLGSCTMKYNPKISEKLADLKQWRELHPLTALIASEPVQGALEVLYLTEKFLCEITGMDAFSLQPLAGAHGELTGLLLIAAYHRYHQKPKRYVIVPDSSHGTNPASAAMCGYEVIVIPTAQDGCMDLQRFKERLSNEVAAVMLTCPNTLGLFNPHIKEIADLAHQAGALMYYDGANLNAIMGKLRPGDVGFDVLHLNLHKTFATPHGGGGPGAGPVGVKKELTAFLPWPRIVKDNQDFKLQTDLPLSIGKVASFYGNFGVILKALIYILLLGKEGLVEASEYAVLNANYILAKLKDYYQVPYNRRPMHECVISASKQAQKGVHALDIAKALIDRGFHPPTMYFPTIVKEALMIEPTETESRQTLDAFIQAMIDIALLAESDPEIIKQAPVTTPVKRVDEVKAARQPKLKWEP